MIRTTLSFCALFGSLILVSKWLQESSRPEPSVAPPAVEPGVESAPTILPPAKLSTNENAIPLVPRENVTTRTTATPTIRLVAYDEDLTEKIGEPDETVANDAEKVQPYEPDFRSLEELLLEDAPTSGKSENEPADKKDDSAGPAANESDEQPATESTPEPELTPELVELRDRLRSCLAYYYFRPENVATRSPWGSMHAMLAYGVDSQLIVNGKRVNAIGYLNYNGVCNGQRLFYLSNGRLQTQIGPGVQGHAGQYLAMLAQSRVKPDYPMLVGPAAADGAAPPEEPGAPWSSVSGSPGSGSPLSM
jgi:hypothetical protein